MVIGLGLETRGKRSSSSNYNSKKQKNKYKCACSLCIFFKHLMASLDSSYHAFPVVCVCVCVCACMHQCMWVGTGTYSRNERKSKYYPQNLICKITFCSKTVFIENDLVQGEVKYLLNFHINKSRGGHS